MHGYSAIEAADDTPRLIPKEAYDQLVSAIYTQRVGRGFHPSTSKEEIAQIFLYEIFQLGQYILASQQLETGISTYKLKSIFRTIHNAEGVKRFLHKSKTLGVLENSPENMYAVWEYVEEHIYLVARTPQTIKEMTTPISSYLTKNLVESIHTAHISANGEHVLELIDHIASLDEYTTEEIENQFVEAFRQSYTHPDQYPHAKIKQPQIWLENFCIIASHTLRNTLKNEISPSRMSSYSQKEIYIALLLHIWYGKAARLQANEIFPSHPETKKQISKKVLEIIEHMKQGNFEQAEHIAAALSLANAKTP